MIVDMLGLIVELCITCFLIAGAVSQSAPVRRSARTGHDGPRKAVPVSVMVLCNPNPWRSSHTYH